MTYCVVTPAATNNPEGFQQWCEDRGLRLMILRTPMITLKDWGNSDLAAMIEAGWVERICGMFPSPEVVACLKAGQA